MLTAPGDASLLEKLAGGIDMVCKDAGTCYETDPAHYLKIAHPPRCPWDPKCPIRTNDPHCRLFWHVQECPLHGECQIVIENESHMLRFSHPPKCQEWETCIVNEEVHIHNYLHPPLCIKGLDCPIKTDASHKPFFRHLAMDCTFGLSCARFLDDNHYDKTKHAFVKPCKLTPFECKESPATNPNHFKSFSHVCPAGFGMCSELQNPEHLKYWIHVAQPCDRDHCIDRSDDHLNATLHANMPSIRPCCKNQFCDKVNLDHIKQWSHPSPLLPSCSMLCVNIGDVEADKNYFTQMLKEKANVSILQKEIEKKRVMFYDNMKKLEAYLDTFIVSSGGGALDPSSPRFQDIVTWFQLQLPVHKCSSKILSSIIHTGMFCSTVELHSIWESNKHIVEVVLNRPSVAQIVQKLTKEELQVVRAYMRQYLRCLRGDVGTSRCQKLLQQMQNNPAESKKLAPAIEIFKRVPTPNLDRQRKLAVLAVDAKNLVDLATLNKQMDDSVQAIATMVEGVGETGINFSADIDLRTNFTVFTVLGPHTATYYGGTNAQGEKLDEVAVVFRPEVMYHPDTYFLPCAAVAYRNGWYTGTQHNHGLPRRQWLGEEKAWEGGAQDDFVRAKFHHDVPFWARVIAKEFICRVVVQKGIKARKVNLSMVFEHYTNKDTDSHSVIEGHLPSFVPLAYAHKIFIKKAAFQTMNGDVKTELKLALKERYDDVVEVVENVTARCVEYAKNPAPLFPLEGFYFGVEADPVMLEERFIPIKLHQNTHGCINVYFKLNGGDIYITFSSAGVLDPTRKCVTIHITNSLEAGEVTVFDKIPRLIGTTPLGRQTGFCKGCRVSSWTHFYLRLAELKPGVLSLTVEHWGPSRVYNRTTLNSEIPKCVSK